MYLFWKKNCELDFLLAVCYYLHSGAAIWLSGPLIKVYAAGHDRVNKIHGRCDTRRKRRNKYQNFVKSFCFSQWNLEL